jgi:hypothetical protein
VGADGIVGVRLEIEFKEFGHNLAEFIAIGTAVTGEAPPATGATWRNNQGIPFMSDLSGRDSGPSSRPGTRPLPW